MIHPYNLVSVPGEVKDAKRVVNVSPLMDSIILENIKPVLPQTAVWSKYLKI